MIELKKVLNKAGLKRLYGFVNIEKYEPYDN